MARMVRRSRLTVLGFAPARLRASRKANTSFSLNWPAGVVRRAGKTASKAVAVCAARPTVSGPLPTGRQVGHVVLEEAFDRGRLEPGLLRVLDLSPQAFPERGLRVLRHFLALAHAARVKTTVVHAHPPDLPTVDPLAVDGHVPFPYSVLLRA